MNSTKCKGVFSNITSDGGVGDLVYKAREPESASPEDIEPEPIEPEISLEDKISEPDIQVKPKPKVVSNKIFGTWDDEPVRISDSPDKLKATPEQQ